MPTENRSAYAPFQREDRYIVIKRSDLKKVPVNYRSALVDPMLSLLSHLPHRECLVIESDWPEYEPTWAAIEARVTGEPAEQHQVEYPPCDYCGVSPNCHPWHGSGMLNGVENRHIHACDDCRGQLPAHPRQHQGEPVAYSVTDRFGEAFGADASASAERDELKLPMRCDEQTRTRRAFDYAQGWNQALDAVEKMNARAAP